VRYTPGLVAESTEGSYLAPLLFSFLSAQKGWQGVACQGRLPAAKISYTAVEIKNYWACLVPTIPFLCLCFALSSWSTLLCHLHVQRGIQGHRAQSLLMPIFLLFFLFFYFILRQAQILQGQTYGMFDAAWLGPTSFSKLGFFLAFSGGKIF